MYFTYILKSKIKNWYYIGYTSNIDNRLKSHNLGRNRSTKSYRPFEIVYLEKFKIKSDAFKKEQQIKKYKHGEAFNKLVG